MRTENSTWGDWGSLGLNPFGTGRIAVKPKQRPITDEMRALARARRLIEEKREQRELEAQIRGY